MRDFIVVYLLLLISSNAFSQNEFLNSNYRLSKDSVKLVAIPSSFDNNINEILISNLNRDSVKCLKVLNIFDAKNRILRDTKLNSSLNKILQKKFSKRKLRHFPNLNNILTKDEINDIKIKLENSDLLLIPKDITKRTVTYVNGEGNTTLSGSFRLYDLNTGEFIFEYKLSFMVEYLAEDINLLETNLIIKFQSYFHKKFILNQKLKQCVDSL